MRDATEREWPLVAFTVSVQAASGMALAAWVVDSLTDASVAPGHRLPIDLAVLGLVALGGASSWFHLGRGARAWRVLVNLRRSPLSREVLATILFGASSLATVVAGLAGAAAVPAWNTVTAVLGLAAVVAAIPVYMVPARPVWNSWWVTGSFVGTLLLVGGAGSVALRAGGGAPRLVGAFIGAAVVGAALQVVSARAMAARFSREWARASHEGLEGPAMGWTGPRRLRLACQVGLAGVLPIAFAIAWCLARGPAAAWDVPLSAAMAVSAVAGIIQGRRLMFDLGASMPRF